MTPLINLSKAQNFITG